MKKLSFLLVALSIVLFSACGNNQGKKKSAKEATKTVSVQEQYITADLKIKMDSLVASLEQLGMIPIFEDAQQGKIKLTDKEKKVKPNYLLPISKANDLVTLSQKYRAVMMYRVDMAIASLYDMPTEDYKQTLAKLVVDINNPAFTADLNAKAANGDVKGFITNIYNEQLENGSINFFWDAATAGIIEQIYVLTKNIDKFIVCFDDQSASEITYRFSLVHDGISSLIPYHPEMKSLEAALHPLFLINAINVKQLRDQLMQIKGEIEVVRNSFLN